MISDERCRRLISKAGRAANLVQFFRESPLVGIELDLERDKGAAREVELRLTPRRATDREPNTES